MLSLLVGTVGGGKSYEAVVYHVLPALRSGRKVITNLPLNTEAFRGIDATYPDLIELRHPTAEHPIPFSKIEDYGSDWRHPVTGAGALYIIDECHIPLPFKETPRAIEDWVSLHRHSASDMVLITQTYQKMSKSIRDLCQNLYKVRKNIAFGDLIGSKSYTRAVYDGIGSRAPLIERSQRTYKPQFFKLYSSHTQGGGKELNPVAFKSIWHHWIFKAVFLFFLLSIYTISKVDWSHSPFNVSSYGKKSVVAAVGAVNASGTSLLGHGMPASLLHMDFANASSADYYGIGDYPFKGSRFVIRGKIATRKGISYLIELLKWDDTPAPVPQPKEPSIFHDALKSSVPVPVPAPKRHFVGLETLQYAGYVVQIFDDCNIKLSFTQNAHTESNLISCSFPQ